MVPEQHTCILKAIDCIAEARKQLNHALYHIKPEMPRKEFERVRKAFDFLCKSNDQL